MIGRQEMLVPPKIPPFEVVDGFLNPIKKRPRNGDYVKIGTECRREAVSIIVGQNRRVSYEPCLFDTLCFEQGKNLVIYQVRPSNRWGHGQLVFIKKQKILIMNSRARDRKIEMRGAE